MSAKKLACVALCSVAASFLLSGCDKKEEVAASAPKPAKREQPAVATEAGEAKAPEPADTATEPAMTPAVPPSSEPPSSTEDAALAKKQAEDMAEGTLNSLNMMIADFNMTRKRFPKDLEELVALKLLAKVPDAPAGQKFVIDPKTKKVVVVKK